MKKRSSIKERGKEREKYKDEEQRKKIRGQKTNEC